MTMGELRRPVKDILRPPIAAARLRTLWGAIEQRQKPRRAGSRTWMQWAIAGVAVASALALFLRAQRSEPGALQLTGLHAVATLEATGAARRFELTDGSWVQLDGGTRLEPTHNDGHDFALVLRSGRAEFEVKPGGPRRWVIDGGLAGVEVVGTHFVVTRTPTLVHVEVARGAVRVRSRFLAGGVRRLAAGESVDVMDTDAGAVAPPSSLDELLARADRAQAAGRVEEAVALLTQVAAADGDRARAALAAFTLGRLEADHRGRPREAAVWFRRAIGLDVPSALAEDAYLRLVRAFEAVGDRDGARATAAEYQRRFPAGRYSERLRSATQ
jgi:transmembrane sensor